MPAIVWSAWSASGTVAPRTQIEIDPSTGYIYRSEAGGTSGSSPPTWPTSLRATVLDGTVTWICWQLAPLFTQKEFEDRLSYAVVKRLLDDNKDGHADASPVLRLRLDASSYVWGLIGGQYSLTSFPSGSALPNELVRIALDVATAMGAERHPRLIARDSEKLFTKARRELTDLKAGVSRVDITPGTTAAVEPKNVGGVLYDGSHRMIVDGADGTNNNGLL